MWWLPACPDLPAAANLPAAMTDRLEQWGPLFESVGLERGVDPELIAAVSWVESRWSATAVSPAGAKGLMQLIPVTGKAMAKRLGIGWDPFDPETNVQAGAEYLSILFERNKAAQQNWWRGDAGLRAVASYFAGGGNVSKYGPSKYDHYTGAVMRAQWALRDTRRRCDGEPDVEPPDWPGRKQSPKPSKPPRPSPAPRPAPAEAGGAGLVFVLILLAAMLGFRR